MNFYMGREIAPIMPLNAQNMAWLSRVERSLQEQTQLILDALSIKRGMKVADVGAGTGFITRQLAHRVGRHGFVVASELLPELLGTLLYQNNLPGNVIPVLSTPTDVRLPANTFDLILLVDTYHEAPRPDLLLRGLHRALKANGRLALVEYRQEDLRVPIQLQHKMNARQAIMEFQANRFRLIQRFDHLPWQHLLVFTKI